MLVISLAYTPLSANEVAASRFFSTHHDHPKLVTVRTRRVTVYGGGYFVLGCTARLFDSRRAMKAEIDLRFDPEPEVVSTARHALDRLENLLPSGKLENVRLVVSFLMFSTRVAARLLHTEPARRDSNLRPSDS